MIFKRCTEEYKKSIFIAQQVALHKGAGLLDVSHLLIGLLAQKDCRANKILGIVELLPQGGHGPTGRRKWTAIKKTIQLSDTCKRVLAHSMCEADRLQDYWIDTEHLVLGILQEGNNSADNTLRGVGLTLDKCRQLVISNRNSRPKRREPIFWWPRTQETPFGLTLQIGF
jgi:ATP-dependent Clp protease ATP-binding subunit ClpC